MRPRAERQVLGSLEKHPLGVVRVLPASGRGEDGPQREVVVRKGAVAC